MMSVVKLTCFEDQEVRVILMIAPFDHTVNLSVEFFLRCHENIVDGENACKGHVIENKVCKSFLLAKDTNVHQLTDDID